MEKSQDRAWLEQLMKRHGRPVRAYVRRRVPMDEADDVVSEVFATAWRRRGEVPDEALPWLYRAAAHHVLHAQRSEARRGRLYLRMSGVAPDDAAAEYDVVADSVDAVRVVDRLLAELPEADAEVLRLWAWERLGPSDMALVLGCSVGTARGRLFRARRRATRLLAETVKPDEVPETTATALFPAR